jgi:hypothetical protein
LQVSEQPIVVALSAAVMVVSPVRVEVK